jgi:uncharacterized protein YndB with AHSA1/START domain
MSHKEIVGWLATRGGVTSGWWQQMVASTYEQVRGRRAVGETRDAGFEVGVSRTLTLSPQQAPGKHIRLTWQPKEWLQPSILQIRLVPSGQKTSLRFHQEKLSDVKTRAKMRQHWGEVLDRLVKLIG